MGPDPVSFEEQLQQLHPVPVSGLEEMLYQAGWQAGRAAAVTAPVSRRNPGLGFFGGAATGLVTASLLFITAAWSGWWPNLNPGSNNLSGEQLASSPEAAVIPAEPAAAGQPEFESGASPERDRRTLSFNLPSWFDSGEKTLARSLPTSRSQVLTAAPVNDRELERLLTDSGTVSWREMSSLDAPPTRARANPEFLRYLPGQQFLPRSRY